MSFISDIFTGNRPIPEHFILWNLSIHLVILFSITMMFNDPTVSVYIKSLCLAIGYPIIGLTLTGLVRSIDSENVFSLLAALIYGVIIVIAMISIASNYL